MIGTHKKVYRPKSSLTLVFAVFLLGFLFTACEGEIKPTLITVVPSATEAPTGTKVPTATTENTATATLTITSTATATKPLTPTLTFTPSPTPFQGFEESTLNSHQGSGALYLFIFGVPGVSQSYFLDVEQYPFQCAIDENYPDRLFCTGEPFENLEKEYLQFSFYNDEEKTQLAYEKYFFTGTFKKYKPLAIAGDPSTWCPERGEGVNCETEYRQYKTNEGLVECIVSTCYDACGYYYSIHTCPDDVPLSDYIFLPPPDER